MANQCSSHVRSSQLHDWITDARKSESYKCDDLQRHDIHISFHEKFSVGSKVTGVGVTIWGW
jgi:hypothetical protein